MSVVLDKLQALDWEQIVELLKQRNVQYGLLAGLVGVYVLRRMLRKPKYNLPPGPRGLPLLGNLMSKTVKNLCCLSAGFENDGVMCCVHVECLQIFTRALAFTRNTFIGILFKKFYNGLQVSIKYRKHVRVLGTSTKMFASWVRQQFGDSYHPVLLSSGKVPVGVYDEKWLCFEERASKSDTVGCYRFALAVGNGRSV